MACGKGMGCRIVCVGCWCDCALCCLWQDREPLARWCLQSWLLRRESLFVVVARESRWQSAWRSSSSPSTAELLSRQESPHQSSFEFTPSVGGDEPHSLLKFRLRSSGPSASSLFHAEPAPSSPVAETSLTRNWEVPSAQQTPSFQKLQLNVLCCEKFWPQQPVVVPLGRQSQRQFLVR